MTTQQEHLVTWSPRGFRLHHPAHDRRVTMCNVSVEEDWSVAPWDSPDVPPFDHCTKCQVAKRQRQKKLAVDATFVEREERRGKAVRTPVFIQMCAECPDCGVVVGVTSSPGPRSLALHCPGHECERQGRLVLCEGRYCADWEAL